jgi:uncharacterized protein (TIGR02118 family)
MSVAYLVIYDGIPEDPDAFVDYYINHHLPIIWTWPQIRSVEVDLRAEGGDALASPTDVFMIARFIFDTIDDLKAALASPERIFAREDSRNFPPFHGKMCHQAVRILDVPNNK